MSDEHKLTKADLFLVQENVRLEQERTIASLESQNQALQEENESLGLFVKEAHEETLALQDRAERAEARVAELEKELLKATTEERRIPDPDGCFGPDDWAHSRCSDDCPPHGLVEPHGVLHRKRTKETDPE